MAAISGNLGDPPQVGPDPIGLAGDAVGTTATSTVIRLRNRPIANVVPNIDDVMAWDGAAWTPRPLPGAELGQVTRLTTLSTTNAPTSPVPYVSLGSVGSPLALEASHVYIGITSWVVTVSSNNTEYWLDVRINGNPSVLGPTQEPLGLANAQTIKSSVVTFFGSEIGPSVYYDMVFAKAAGSGSVTLRAATIAIWRIA